MSEPTSQPGLCLDCNYSLRGLATNACPECGRGFDPSDPATMNMGRPSSRFMRSLLRPPGWPLNGAAVITLIWIGYMFSVPGTYGFDVILTFYASFAVACWWLGRGALAIFARWRTQLRIEGRWWRWWFAPLMGIVAITMVGLRIPERITLRLSMPAMNALAQRSATAGPTWTQLPPQQIGLYSAEAISISNAGVVFMIRGSGFMLEQYGYAYSPTPLRPGDDIADTASVVRHIRQNWYLIAID